MGHSAPFFADVAEAPPPAGVIWVHAADGVRLRVAHWPVGPKGMIAIFPGRTEVIEKYGRVVADLARAGYGAALIDWRGQGLSDRPTGLPLRGHIGDFAEYQQDVAAFRAVLDQVAGDAAPRYLLSHSMGGCIALRALITGFPARACAFSAPMWGLPVSTALAQAVRLATSTLGLAGGDLREIPGAGVKFRLWENVFDDNELTRDLETYSWMQEQVARHEALRLGAPSLRWLTAALAETRALAHLPAPDLPAFCGLGTREMIVSPEAIKTRMEGWARGALERYSGALHELMMELPEVRADFLRRSLALFDAN
jgi:lysophospholipase